MIFVNEGVVQITTNPVQLMFDLAMIIRCIYEKIEEDGVSKETADTMVELALRFSEMSDEEIQNFMLSLPSDKPISFQDMLIHLDKQHGVTMIKNGFIS